MFKRIGLALLVIQVTTYTFLSDVMLEREACDKYLEFTKRRFANPYNKNVSEIINVSSCGDEFFRDPELFTSTVRASNPDYPPESLNEWGAAFEGNFSQSILFNGYPQDISAIIQAHTDTIGTRNCILYDLCSMSSIPLFHTRVRYGYLFSSRPPDIHAMYYNGQGLTCTSNYVWLLFTWIEVTGEIKDPSQ